MEMEEGNFTQIMFKEREELIIKSCQIFPTIKAYFIKLNDN
jgi:hypothetical protein